MKKRILWIDIARAIAIIMVIIGHSQDKYLGDYWSRLIEVVSLPTFFVLSGYLYRKKKISDFFRGSWYNILLPYIGTVSLMILIRCFAKLFPNSWLYDHIHGKISSLIIAAIYGTGSGQPITLPMTNLKIEPIGAIWFLLAFFWGGLIFRLILSVFKNKWLIFVSALILTILGYLLGKVIILPWSLDSALVAQLFFVAGYFIKKYELLDRVNMVVYILLLLNYFSLGSMFGLVLATASSEHVILGYIESILSVIFLMKTCQLIESRFGGHDRILTGITFIGAQSLSILCFHLIDLDYIDVWNHLIRMGSTHNYLIAVYIGVIWRICFAIGMAVLIRYIPVLRSFYMHRRYSFTDWKLK